MGCFNLISEINLNFGINIIFHLTWDKLPCGAIIKQGLINIANFRIRHKNTGGTLTAANPIYGLSCWGGTLVPAVEGTPVPARGTPVPARGVTRYPWKGHGTVDWGTPKKGPGTSDLVTLIERMWDQRLDMDLRRDTDVLSVKIVPKPERMFWLGLTETELNYFWLIESRTKVTWAALLESVLPTK